VVAAAGVESEKEEFEFERGAGVTGDDELDAVFSRSPMVEFTAAGLAVVFGRGVAPIVAGRDEGAGCGSDSFERGWEFAAVAVAERVVKKW